MDYEEDKDFYEEDKDFIIYPAPKVPSRELTCIDRDKYEALQADLKELRRKVHYLDLLHAAIRHARADSAPF